MKNLLERNTKINVFSELTNIHRESRHIAKIINDNLTPLFISDSKILEKGLNNLEESCKNNWDNFQIAYSFKTNYEIARLKILKDHGLWAEVVSGWEYQMAKKIGYRGREIVFNGPSKTSSDLDIALNDGVLVFVDNFEELEKVRKIAGLQKKNFKIGIRLKTKIPRLYESRFGFSVDNDEASKAVSLIEKDPHINLAGLHMHIGSDIDNPKIYRFAASAMTNFIKNNIKDFENKIKYLDFGGGFPSHGLPPYGRLRWNPRSIEKYVNVISSQLLKIFKDRKPTLIFEPGRYLVDDAVFFVTKVTSCRDKEAGQILTTDATITMLPLVQYRPQIVKIYDKDMKEKKSQILNTIVYGASCRENDILYDKPLPKAKVGDVLIYYVTGAYNQNMASEFIFNKPKSYFF